MESIGEKLRTEREQKGLTIEQIARDTNIAKRYIGALEEEDFAVFPGDPYLIGFLRNYAEYLGIDSEEMVALYRNFKIQSQPVPMDELLDTKKAGRPRRIFIAVVVLVVLAVGAYLVYKLVLSGREPAPSVSEPQESETGVYELTDEILERRFFEQDIVSIPFKDDEYRIVLSDIGDTLTLQVPGGTNVLRIGDERAVDLDGDAKMDVKVSLSDLDRDAGRSSAVLRFDRFVKETVATGVVGAAASEPESAAENGETAVETAGFGRPGASSRAVEPQIVTTASSPEPFRMVFTFRGNCLLRYVKDGDIREERYFQRGEDIELQVRRNIRLWISNAGSLSARIFGVDINFGSPGEVSAAVVGWRNDADEGEWVLRVDPMY